MITPITATFPALNFPKEVDYPTQEDWAAFSASAELNYGILSGTWSDKSEEFKAQTNNLALEIQEIGENAFNAISLDTIEDLATYTGTGLVIVKNLNRGGTFISKTAIEIDPNTGSLYMVNGGTVFAKLGGGFWVRQYSGAVNVKWFGAKGDGVTDDIVAIQNAIVYSQLIFVPEGTFLIGGVDGNNSSLYVLSDITITGISGKSILLQSNTGRIIRNNINDVSYNISISGITFKNNTGVFSEQIHLISLYNPRNLVIERCEFIGFQGDAIYIGSFPPARVDPPENVLIQNNIFNGINKDNRNSLSVISCDGLRIINNNFLNCSRAGMPGPIDIEPNADQQTAINRDILISGNTFKNCGGDYCINYSLFTTGIAHSVLNINISNNHIHNDCTNGGIRIFTSDPITDTTPDMGIVIKDNIIESESWGITFAKVKGMIIRDNTMTSGIYAGLPDVLNSIGYKNIEISNNLIDTSGYIIVMGGGENLSMLNNTMTGGNALGLILLQANLAQTASGLIFRNNSIYSSNVSTPSVVRKGALYSYNMNTCEFHNNTYTGMTAGFTDKYSFLPAAITSITTSVITPRYSKDYNNVVYVTGEVHLSSTGVIFTLPVGMRPVARTVVAVTAGWQPASGLGILKIDTNGEVSYLSGSLSQIAINFTFKASVS